MLSLDSAVNDDAGVGDEDRILALGNGCCYISYGFIGTNKIPE